MNHLKEQSWDILFSTLHAIETNLFASAAERFRQEGLNVGFLLFDESSSKHLTGRDLPFFSIYDLMRERPYEEIPDDSLQHYLAGFEIANIRNLFMHERLGYNRKDERALARKTLHYLQVLDDLFARQKVRCVIQELGGFAATQAVFYAARKHNISNIYYEPACFPKRVFFNINTIYSEIPKEIMEGTPSHENMAWSQKYIDEYFQSKRVIVPLKDRHSFRDMKVGRMFNKMNAKRLSSKLYRKYISREREEFDEIGYVIKFNLMKLLRRSLLSRLYSLKDARECDEKFIYYPFHVPHDVQLSVRSRAFYVQEAFVDYLSRVLPYGYKLYVKEHPASIGAHSYSQLRRLLKNNRNIRLVHPRVNSFHLIEKAALVVTVNSKVGFEALMQNKKVLVVGKAFYRGRGLTYDVDDLDRLEEKIAEALKGPLPKVEDVRSFIAKLYQWSYPCELFDDSPENQSVTFDSLSRYLREEGLLEEDIRCEIARSP